jgi:acetyl/propionyl-CoA carboxylase alpha subunit
LETERQFAKAAQQIGFPLLVKAAAGGGGKGMRVVTRAAELGEALESARQEAINAFGDGRLLIEKYVLDAHHIEFQVFGDRHGNLVHLFERECSVQRRHQKIIEETPSPLLTPALRTQMGAAALAAAKAVGYTNAGTVEFIVEPRTLNYYFLEMNTRLQVEHPITELTTGLDLVHWQLRVAAGERFPYQQAALGQHGHALECRIYAEDPANGFLPGTGKLLTVIEPQGPGIRLDSGVRAGDEISHFYDPLLAKLIVHAEDRASAVQRMLAALRAFVIHGVTTDIDFLQALLAHPDFQKGRATTRWAESTFVDWAPSEPSLEHLLAAALAEIHVSGVEDQVSGSGEPDPFSPWKNPGRFRN